jgi:hypothetical protein
MKSLLKTKPHSQVNNAIENNIPNGNDAEVFAASQLLQSVGGEISWGSRNEDGRKIDLICSFDHPWVDSERVLILIQVKSGDSFGAIHGSGFKLKSAAKSAALRTSHSICILWVNRISDKCFWAYLHPHSTSKNQIYGEHHKVNPALIFDLTRCQSQHLPIKSGGKGLILSIPDLPLKELRKKVISKYVSYSDNKIVSPCLGEIECTRVGWRHMFRKTRSKVAKEKSLATILYLDKILSDYPTGIYVTNREFEIIDGYEYRRIVYVLSFESAKIFLKGESISTKIVVRIFEEIRWPENWRGCSILSQKTDRILKLESCYFK